LALAAALLMLLVPAGARAEPTYAEHAAALIQSYVEADRFSGAVLVAHEGQVLLRQGFGFADRRRRTPNMPETQFRIGSITKQFTAAAILQLVERGLLALDDPVTLHYPAAPPTWSKVTLRHLLAMRSGIVSLSDTPGYWEHWSKARRTPEESIDLIRAAPLRFEPGTRYEYSNSNHTILGRVIEHVTGLSYADYLSGFIFAPLGMRDTGLDHDDLVLPKRAQGYEREGGARADATAFSMSIPYAAGSLYSTVDDLLKWDIALAEARVVGPDSLREMVTDQGGGYGLGVYVGMGVQAHSGGIAGFHAILCRYPEDEFTVIVLANLAEALVAWIANELTVLHFGAARAQGPLCHEAY
jgi:CubicO group peptidase (beta-lactamase class C family)